MQAEADPRRHVLFCGTEIIQAKAGGSGTVRAVVLQTGEHLPCKLFAMTPSCLAHLVPYIYQVAARLWIAQQIHVSLCILSADLLIEGWHVHLGEKCGAHYNNHYLCDVQLINYLKAYKLSVDQASSKDAY